MRDLRLRVWGTKKNSKELKYREAKFYLLFNSCRRREGSSKLKLTSLPLILFIFQKCLHKMKIMREKKKKRQDQIMQIVSKIAT